MIHDLEVGKLEIAGTCCTPHIECSPDGKILFGGRSIALDASPVFDRLADWIFYYIHNPAETTTIKVNLEYCNTQSLKFLLGILDQLNVACRNFNVEWLYEEDDEDMLDLGEILSSVCSCSFDYKAVQAA